MSLPAGTGAAARRVLAALTELREVLGAVRLPLATPVAAGARTQAQRVTQQLDDYVLARYSRIDAPLLAVVGGSTGAGKSTLVNALLGAPVTSASAIRPTTRRPLLVHHLLDEEWFAGDRVLPGLARVHVSGDAAPTPAGEGTHGELELRVSDRVPPGLAVLDAPDIDSVVEDNRRLAGELLAAADLWVFVTTAARYADAVPWELLAEAAARRIVVAVVLNRVPQGVSGEVRHDLSARLAAAGLGRAPLFTVAEVPIPDGGLLPDMDVAPLRAWLGGIATDSASRAAVARATLGGAVDDLVRRTATVGEGAREQSVVVDRLREDVDIAYGAAEERAVAAAGDGSMLRGEVLARWQELIGTGELMRALESRVGRIRDRIVSALTGKGSPVEPVTEAIETGMLAVLVEEVRRASAEAERAWLREPAARELVRAAVAHRPDDEAIRARAADEVRAWQSALLDLVREEGADRRQTARALSFGVNILGAALMVAVFASTAFIPTGAEVAVGGGTVVVAQKILEAVFGDDEVRRMAERAREDLAGRIRGLLAEGARHFTDQLDALGVDEALADRIDSAARAVADARRAENAR
ncbi:dynamin family protein [Georgenia sp. Z1491]|uniref:dynamin family protein n=1 Tax=Georgenia sp. Z1491 TaxID=3416707 RepID=UPI003CE95CD3